MENLNTLAQANLMQMQYINLRAHIKNKVGPNKTYDAIPKLKLPQKIHTHSTIKSLMINTKQGSGSYRKILIRSNKSNDIHNPANWKTKLADNLVTRTQLKQSKINLHSKYLECDIADTLTRLKLGKTLFGTQLYKCGLSEHPYCKTCLKELGEEIPENITHATYECMFVADVVHTMKNTFFPQNDNTLKNRDILLAITEDKHPFYTGRVGHYLASLIWDLFLYYIVKTRNKSGTPISSICVHEVKSQINRILKILPHTEISYYITKNAKLSQIFQDAV